MGTTLCWSYNEGEFSPERSWMIHQDDAWRIVIDGPTLVAVCEQHLDVWRGMAEPRVANDASGWDELIATCKDANVD